MLVRGLLSSHVAERLACGMSHVVVVATQRSKAGGHGSSGSGANPVTRLLTWGQNGRGQLGIGEGREDHFMPQVVSAVAGRRILNLACGGNYTLAVCEHDPRAARWSRDSGADPDALLGLSSAASGSLVSGSGPSRLHLSAAALGGGGGSGGGPGPPSERGNGGATPAAAGGVAAQRGGLPVSASYSSLASSVPSSRGEGGSGGGGAIASLSRRSERGRLEGRLSDRGFPVYSSGSSSYHTAGAGSSGREQQHGPVSSSRSMGLLTRSLDRSLIGLGLAPGGRGDASVGPAASSSSHASHAVTPGSDPRTVSWAPSPSGARCQRGAAGRAALSGSHNSRGFGGGGGSAASSGPSLSLGQSGGLQDLSLSALASAAKRSHLPLPRSFKKLGGGAVLRHDSTHSSGSSNSRAAAGWGGSDWQQHHPYQQQQQHYGGTPGRGQAGGGCRDAPWLVQGRSSYRQLSYTAGRSEPDLATVSITSSMTSAGLSATISPSLQSLQEGRAADAPTEGGGGPDAGSSEFQRQLR